MFDSSMLVLGAANPVAVMLCLLVVVLPIGLLIGAVILRASVSLFNKFAGFDEDSRYRVPEPSMLNGMGMLLLSTIANAIFGFLIGAIGGATGMIQVGPEGVDRGGEMLLNLVSLPVSFVIFSAILSSMLPTTFKRAMGVVLCQYLIVLALAIVIGLLVFLVVMATGAN
ncbi:MAG: hypothetical protein CME31_20440 [Gimesia sp.]|jgi:hypothetical protein|uniref:Uncharacterized protein n=1 Tax=Gimesia maris TaxID=122 RepID=A0A3D3RE80_9PLAN|nr:hypothetical protein [Gimesia sp.]HCO27144.1 hypothetical protein [Gimesia maris]|tara:strand:- start:2305 stop:2811 length:507 start_codon:yes stop_codon:yes gene_type:complete